MIVLHRRGQSPDVNWQRFLSWAERLTEEGCEWPPAPQRRRAPLLGSHDNCGDLDGLLSKSEMPVPSAFESQRGGGDVRLVGPSSVTLSLEEVSFLTGSMGNEAMISEFPSYYKIV